MKHCPEQTVTDIQPKLWDGLKKPGSELDFQATALTTRPPRSVALTAFMG